jgi:transposase
MIKVGEAVQPIINLLRDHLLDAELVFGDETVIQVLKESGRAAQSKSYLWAQMNGHRAAGALVRLCPGPWWNPRRAALCWNPAKVRC